MLKLTKSNIAKFKHILNLSNKFNNITVMLSAGVDSVSALHFIVKNKKQFASFLNLKESDFNLQAYHFNHKLRTQNNKMEECARNFCNEYNIKLVVGTAQTTIKSEAEARTARFDYLASLVKNNLIFTAHHLNDCVESYVLNVLRGHEGYVPIPFTTELKHNQIVHPFLFNTKDDFKQYAEHFNLNRFIVEDETNNIIKGSRRNLIRQQILPLLKQNDIVLNKTVHKKLEQKLHKYYG
jgi:tRNA(Ile)-lysidine synthase